MRSFHTSVVAAFVLTVTHAASAASPVTPVRASLPVRAEEPAPVAAPAPVTAEAPKAGVAPTGRGPVFFVGAGMMALGGSVRSAAPISATEKMLSLRGGFYMTQHVGIVGGLEVGAGEVEKGCRELLRTAGYVDTCTSRSVRLPMVVELSLMDRTRGPYMEIGGTLASTHVLMGNNASAVAVTPLELSIGAGVRVPVPGGWVKSIDAHARVDAGAAAWLRTSKAGDTESSGIQDDRRRSHANASFVVALGF